MEVCINGCNVILTDTDSVIEWKKKTENLTEWMHAMVDAAGLDKRAAGAGAGGDCDCGGGE